MKSAIAILASAAALLSACATSNDYQTQVAAWEGRTSDDLAAVWGQPSAKAALPDGGELWTYRATVVKEQAAYSKSTGSIVTSSTDEYGTPSTFSNVPTSRWVPAMTFKRHCETNFVLVAQRVASVSFAGKGCKDVAES